MWVYSQSKHSWTRDGVLVSEDCYAGNGECLNRPDAQNVHGKGPLPRGAYKMGAYLADGDADRPHLGIGIIPLKPSVNNQMFGRSGFYIHGKGLSEGCICYGHAADRKALWDSGDHDVEVVE